MAINGIRQIPPELVIDTTKDSERAGRSERPDAPSFGEALEKAITSVDDQMQRGDALGAAYVAGEEVDLHTVLLEMQKADTSFRTLVQVRNRLIEAYKEIMRMPV